MAGPFKLDNQYANYAGHWLANTAYATGKRVIAESANAGDGRKYVFEATTGGTSADPGPPTWDITPGNTTNDGTVVWTCREATTWANAHGKMKWVALRVAAGEVLHIDDGHTETVAANETLVFNGTRSSSVNVICVDKSTDAAVSGYGAVKAYNSSTGFYDLYVEGMVYFWGVFFDIGDEIYIKINAGIIFENSKITFNHTPYLSLLAGSMLELFNCDVGSTVDAFHILLDEDTDHFKWVGGALIGDLNNLIKLSGLVGGGTAIELIGVDLSSMVGGTLINNTIPNLNVRGKLLGLKLNATQPVLYSGSAFGGKTQLLMDIVDDSNTIYKFRKEYQYGYAQDETSKVITGKALYDGTNEFAVKMVSRATPTPTFYGPWRYHLTTLRETGFAANRTYTVHIAQDHASVQPDALDNDEIWIEVVYPDDSTAQFNIANDKIATPTTTPAAQTTSTESWEGLAATTRLQELAVTIASADGKNGPVEIWVCLAKESKTVYVCPEVYVS